MNKVKVNIIMANCVEIRTSEGVSLQSYNSIIAYTSNRGETTLDETYYDYSKATGRHRNYFLNETLKETRAKIKSGVYKLADLN